MDHQRREGPIRGITGHADEEREKSSPRVLVLHNRSLYAEVVADLLRKQCRLEVTQARATTRTARVRVQQAAPDLLIVDSQDVRLNAHALLAPLLREHPDLRVLCLAMGGECRLGCLAGVKCINTKDELLAAIKACEACAQEADQTNAARPD